MHYTVITSSAGVVAKYCDEYLCVYEDISGITRAIFTKFFFVHVAYVLGSVLLCITYRQDGGNGSAVRAKCNLRLPC